MANFTTYVGALEVIHSGTLMGGATDNMRLVLDGMTVSLEFIRGEGDPKVSFGEATDKEMVIKLENFTNTLGTSWEAIIGTYNQRKLHLSIAVWFIGKPDDGRRILHYSWMLGAQTDG